MGFISPTSRVANLYIDTLGVLDFGAADVTITHSTDTLTLAGGVLLIPDGSVDVPSLAIAADPTSGVYANSGAFTIAGGGVAIIRFVDPPVFKGGLGLGNTVNTPDIVFDREGAAILRMGNNSATPIAQTIKGPDARAGTDTNTAGANMTLAPGRSTGTAAGGVLYLATSPKGATGTAANALVNRVQLDFEGVAGYSPQDAAATPVEPTGPLKCFAHNKSVADDGVVTLPAITTNAWGTCVAGDASVRTQFVVDASGTVTLVNNTASVVANADTDTNLCIGTAGTQEPLQIKNRLGAVRVLNIVVWYD